MPLHFVNMFQHPVIRRIVPLFGEGGHGHFWRKDMKENDFAENSNKRKCEG